MFDAALALENMVLEAQELGIGTLYIGAFDAKKAGSVLGVPEGYSCVVLLPLGYPDDNLKQDRGKTSPKLCLRTSSV